MRHNQWVMMPTDAPGSEPAELAVAAAPPIHPVPERLAAAVALAEAAAAEEAGGEQIGAHVAVYGEDDGSATHLFEAVKPGYRGWRWAVTVAAADPNTPITVSEIVLLPGPDSLVGPDWLPWEHRVQAGDLGVGDLLPTAPDDPRLVPGYVESDDPAVEDVAMELGLGRMRVLSRPGRLDAAERWQEGAFGPTADMARSAPGHCGSCGFYLPVAGLLGAAFGVCGNEYSPADGRSVHVGYGCGAHSEAVVEQASPVLVADLIYDDALLDMVVVERVPAVAEPEPRPAETEPADAESIVAEPEPAEVEPAEAEAVEEAPVVALDPSDAVEAAAPVTEPDPEQ